jgi:hypothetical protein
MGKKTTRKRLARKYLRVVEPSAILAPALSGLDRVVSEKQAAELLGYSHYTLRREFQAGRGPARVRLSEHRIGYRLSELYRYLEAHTEKSGGHQAVRHHHGPPPSPSVA